ncbi:hypothetical protein AGMMS49942_09970 [Spirochaetia bacterium]|nr:hypothetical protein AGMMS49942_09970 [Spirochaetia bacterium]
MKRGIRFMKRFFVMFTLFCSVSSMGFSASFQEDLEIYTYLYDNAGTSTEKLDILQVLQAQKLTGTGEFYARAFNQLVNQATTIPVAEQGAANDLAQTLAALIGDEKYATSAPDLWRAYGAFPNAPLVKAECLISLARVEAKEFLPQIVQVLRDLNVPLRGSEEAEAKGYVVRGAILALEKYRDISGYMPVFDISVSGYPKRILDLAKGALPVILEDPSELLTAQVIRGSGYGSSAKVIALQVIEASNVPQSSKAVAAAAALEAGWGAQPTATRERTEIVTLRKTSIGMIGRYGVSDPVVYPLLERSYKQGSDDNEKIGAIQTLAAVATDDSAQQLSSFLTILVGRVRDKTNTEADERMIRAIIPAIGMTGKAQGKTALQDAINAPTTPAIKELAQQALNRLPK